MLSRADTRPKTPQSTPPGWQLSSGISGRLHLEYAVWVLERAYGFAQERIAGVLDALIATEELRIEASDDVALAALQYGRGGAGFSDLMIAAAAQRAGAQALYTFDQKAARLPNATLLRD